MDDVLVRADGLRRSFGSGTGRVTAVVDVTFTVCGSDRIALMGPSGSGKSTLIHLIAGLHPAHLGLYRLARSGHARHAAARAGGRRLPRAEPSPTLDGLGERVTPGDPGRRRCAGGRCFGADLLEIFEVDAVAQHFPEELSGGRGNGRHWPGRSRARPGWCWPTSLRVNKTRTRPQGDRRDPHAGYDRGYRALIATHDARVADRLPAHWTMRDGILTMEAIPCSA